MMANFGVCTPTKNAGILKSAGWDFVEENTQSLFRGTEGEEAYAQDGQQRIAGCVLPVVAANCLVPGALKITGPAVDLQALKDYMTAVLSRAGKTTCRTLVFGSGGARQVPESWDKCRATEQIVEFGRMAAPLAQQHGVTIVLEHLTVKECNIVNTLREEFAIFQQVNHPNFKCLLDTYHLWTDEQPLEDLKPLLPHIRHVHLADKEGRVAPGESGKSDYRPVFAMLKQAGYDGNLSVEAMGFNDLAGTGPRVLEFLKKQWNEA